MTALIYVIIGIIWYVLTYYTNKLVVSKLMPQTWTWRDIRFNLFISLFLTPSTIILIIAIFLVQGYFKMKKEPPKWL